MIALTDYIERFNLFFAAENHETPWHLASTASDIILRKISSLNNDFRIFNNVAIHKTVTIDSHAIIKGPAIISANCFVGSHSYLRGGVFLDENVSIGPACEVKSSFLFANTALGHFNFVGDSILGSNINLEAGAVIANHYNERLDKTIHVSVNGTGYPTGVQKFGALVGDNTKIGANAVLSPGTILPKDTVVGRLQLINQEATST